MSTITRHSNPHVNIPFREYIDGIGTNIENCATDEKKKNKTHWIYFSTKNEKADKIFRVNIGNEEI